MAGGVLEDPAPAPVAVPVALAAATAAAVVLGVLVVVAVEEPDGDKPHTSERDLNEPGLQTGGESTFTAGEGCCCRCCCCCFLRSFCETRADNGICSTVDCALGVMGEGTEEGDELRVRDGSSLAPR